MKEIRQVRINLLTNIISLIISIVICLLYTPYLVKTLGIVAYGIVPLSLIINQYINVFTGSLTAALTRYYSISLKQERINEASRYISTSIIASSVFIMIISPFIIVFINNIEHIFNIPSHLLRDAKILFIYTILSFAVSLISSSLNISLYSINRLDYMNIIKIARIMIKAILVIYYFNYYNINIKYIGLANIIAELLVFCLSYIFYKNATKGIIRISYRSFDKTYLYAMLSMTVWTMMHQLGDTGLYKTDTVIVNIFWGVKESGVLGALSELSGYIMLIISVISSLYGPLIMIAYSNAEHDEVQKLTKDNSLFIGIITALLTGLLIGFSKPIISVWLGDKYIMYNEWFIIKLLSIPAYSAAGIYAFTYRTWNKVRMPAIITIIIGIFNFIISCYLSLDNNKSYDLIKYILIISSILIVIQSYGLNAFCYIRIYKGNIKRILIDFCKINITLIITSLLSMFISNYMRTYSIIEIFSMICGLGMLCMYVAYYFFLNERQKLMVQSIIHNK